MKLTLPLPAPSLQPNARACWQAKSRAVKKARWDAAQVASTARDKPPEPWERAAVRLTFYFRSKRKRDTDNLIGYCKSYFDALQDAGVILNDSGLTHLPPVQLIDRENPRVEIEIVEQP